MGSKKASSTYCAPQIFEKHIFNPFLTHFLSQNNPFSVHFVTSKGPEWLAMGSKWAHFYLCKFSFLEAYFYQHSRVIVKTLLDCDHRSCLPSPNLDTLKFYLLIVVLVCSCLIKLTKP